MIVVLDFVFNILVLYMQAMANFWFYPVFCLALAATVPCILRHFFWRS